MFRYIHTHRHTYIYIHINTYVHIQGVRSRSFVLAAHSSHESSTLFFSLKVTESRNWSCNCFFMGFCTKKHGLFDELGQNRVPHPSPKLGHEEVKKRKKKNMRLFSNSAVISASVLQCETVESRWISDGAPGRMETGSVCSWWAGLHGHGSLLLSTANVVCSSHVLRGDGDVSRSGLWASTALAACPSRCTRCVVTGVNDGMGEVLVEGQ